jgi:hypothetical protein
MSSADRKLLRQKQKDAEKGMSSQLNMFDRIPDKCDTCHAPFDKKSKEMAKTWFIHVKHAEKIVRLFCPECMAKAKKVVENASHKHEVEIVQKDT